jgi:hypothetical protein
MQRDKLNQWLLLISQLGILMGLILVGYQIQQTTELAKIQLFSDITSSRIDMAGATLGENSAPTIAKSLTEPEALTLAELYVMDAFLIRGLNEVRRAEVLRRLGLDIGISTSENIHAFYFGNEFAQKWWAGFMESHTKDDVLIEVDRLIRSTSPDRTSKIFDYVRTPEISDPK